MLSLSQKLCRKQKKRAATVGSSETLEEASTIQEMLGEVFAEPLTHKTSLYKQYWEEQKALRRDARDPNYGGEG